MDFRRGAGPRSHVGACLRSFYLDYDGISRPHVVQTHEPVAPPAAASRSLPWAAVTHFVSPLRNPGLFPFFFSPFRVGSLKRLPPAVLSLYCNLPPSVSFFRGNSCVSIAYRPPTPRLLATWTISRKAVGTPLPVLQVGKLSHGSGRVPLESRTRMPGPRFAF